MSDAAIKVGDVCHDLVERGKVQVLDVAAPSVAIHQEQNDYDVAEYKANALLDVQPDERVYRCVYLPENPSVSFSGTYDFPTSRLARCPVEAANQDLERVQHSIAIAMFERLFSGARRFDDAPSGDALAELAADVDIPASVVAPARELADVDDRFPEADADE